MNFSSPKPSTPATATSRPADRPAELLRPVSRPAESLRRRKSALDQLKSRTRLVEAQARVEAALADDLPRALESYTGREIAAATGMSARNARDLKAGMHRPSAVMLAMLAQALPEARAVLLRAMLGPAVGVDDIARAVSFIGGEAGP